MVNVAESVCVNLVAKASEFDFSSSRDYLENMHEEYNRSEFHSKSNKYQDLMDDYDRLKESYRKSLKTENEVIDSIEIGRFS